MATLPDLRPNSTISNTGVLWVGSAAWDAINEEVSSPNYSDWIYQDAKADDTLVVGLTSVPANFGNMDTISIAIEVNATQAPVDDSMDYYVQITKAGNGTSLVDEVLIAHAEALSQDSGEQFAGTITAAGQSATEAEWNAAELRIRIDYTAVKGTDTWEYRLHEIEVRGTYSTAAVVIDMDAITLASSPQALNLIADQTISMGYATLASSAQAMEGVGSIPVVVPLSVATLVSSAESLWAFAIPSQSTDLADLEQPNSQHRLGPFSSGDALYMVGLRAGDKEVGVWKCTGDPTTLTNWSTQDGWAVSPNTIGSVSSILVGTDIHIATWDISASGSVRYLKFDCSTDTWTINHEIACDPDPNPTAGSGVSIAVRSDGDVIIMHTIRDVTDTYDVMGYSRREVGVWTSGIQVGDSVASQSIQGVLQGSSDRMHFFYHDVSENVLQRCLNSSNVLQTENIVATSIPYVSRRQDQSFIRYNGGVDCGLIVCDWVADIRMDYIYFTSADVPSYTTISDMGLNSSGAGLALNKFMVSLAVDGTTAYVIYSPFDDTGDIWYDFRPDGGSFNGAIEAEDAVTANSVYGGIYTRSGTKRLGWMRWDNPAVEVRYGEIDLSISISMSAITLASSAESASLVVPPAQSTTLADLIFPDTQRRLGPWSSGGALYMAGFRTGTQEIGVWKCTGDPTVLTNWSTQGGWVEVGVNLASLGSILDGTDIHIATWDNNISGLVRYHKFDCSTDTWTIKDEEACDPTPNPLLASMLSVAIAVRSDGDVIIFHTSNDGTYDLPYYSRREASSWTSNIPVVVSPGESCKLVAVIHGSSDRMHFFWITLGEVLHQRTLTSANVIQTDQTINSGTDYLYGSWQDASGIRYNSGADCGLFASDTLRLDYIYFTSADNPTYSTISDIGKGSAGPSSWSGKYALSAAVYGTDAFVVYADFTDKDIYYDRRQDGASSFVGFVENTPAVQADAVHAESYTRASVDRIGYIWTDDPIIAYAEFIIPTIIALDAVTLASSPQNLTLAGAAPIISMSAVTLASSPQSLAVKADQTISMGAVTLASSAQSLSLVTDQIILMDTIWLRTRVQRMMGPAVEGYVTGYRTAGSAESTARAGSAEVWINPDDALTSDGDFPFSFITDPEYTDYLHMSDFGFTNSDVPIGATIVGIELLMERAGVQSNNIQDSAIYVSVSGSPYGDNKAEIDAWHNYFELIYRPSSGAPTDDWNAGLDQTDIVDSEFGVLISAEAIGGSGDQNPYVDCVWLRIYYAEVQTVALSAATLASSAQTLIASAEAQAQTVALSAVTLTSSAQAIRVLADQTVHLAHISTYLDLPSLDVNFPEGVWTRRHYPSIATNVAHGDDDPWENLDGAFLPSVRFANENNNFAFTQTGPNEKTDYLQLTGLGFTSGHIPTSSIIVGIEVEVMYLAKLNHTRDATARLILNGTPQGDNKAVGTTLPNTWTIQKYGSPTDDWNAGLDPVDLHEVGFGFEFQVEEEDGISGIPRVDFVTVRVWYGTTQSVAMSAVTLASSPQGLIVVSTVALPMGAETLASSAQALDVIAGAVTIPMGVATLASSAQGLDVATGSASIPLDSATLVSSPQALDVIPGSVTIGMGSVSLVSSAQSLNVSLAIIIPISSATLASSAQGLDVIAGATSVQMGVATLISSAQSLDLSLGAVSVSMSAVTLASSPQLLNIAKGGVTISLDAISLVSSAQALSLVLGGVSIPLGATTLASSPQDANIQIGAISISMGAFTLASSPQSLAIATGAVSVALSAVTLASSPQSFTLVALGADQTIGMSAVILASSPQSILSITDQTISMGYASLASSAQSLSVVAGDVTISLSDVSLASSAQGLSIITGSISVSLSAITLASSPQGFTLISLGADQTIAMGYASLVSAPQALEVLADQIIAMSSATLASSAQSISVIAGGVTIPLNEVSLVSSAQGLSIIAGAVTIPLSEATLVSSAQGITAIGGAISVQMGSISLVSSPQGLIVDVGPVSVVLSMSAITLVSSAQTLSLAIGGVSVSMDVATLVASPQDIHIAVAQILAMQYATIASSPQGLTLLPGGISAQMSAVTLVSVIQALSILKGETKVELSPASLIGSPQALGIIPGATSVPMDVATLLGNAVSMGQIYFPGILIAALLLSGRRDVSDDLIGSRTTTITDDPLSGSRSYDETLEGGGSE